MSVKSSALNVERSAPKGAVFLSYASQDAEAAKRIADALRASGVEVWFDQSELVGGDAWDAKIRKQIGSCALFVPVISTGTEARREGYFRLEWRLAVERMRQMDDDLPFLLPVVIDGTKDAGAHVPDRFRETQWTRLPGGETPPAFAARVKKLLEGSDVGSPLAATSRASHQPSPRLRPTRATPLQGVPTPSRKVYALLALAAFAIAGAAGWWILRDRGNVGTAATTPAPVPVTSPAAPLSEARQLANKAKTLIADGDDANREALVTAEELLKRAVDLAPADGEVTAIYAQVSRNFDRFGYDRSSARRDLSRRLAERAVMLAPDSAEAQFALAYYYYRENPPEAERMLREMLVRQPDDKRLLFTLGLALRQQGARRQDEAVETWQRAANLPGSDAASWAEIASWLEGRGRIDEAEAALDRSLALKPGGRTLMFKLRLQLFDRGDLDGALTTLRKLPPWAPSDDRGAFLASQFWLWRRQPDQVIAALSRLPRDYLSDNQYTGPKLALTGQAHQLAGRTAAARSDWNQALQLVERMLAAERTDALLYWRAWLQAALGDRALAEASMRTYDETVQHFPGHNVALARIQLLLGNVEAALISLKSEDQFAAGQALLGLFTSSRLGALRYDPTWDPLRGDPRFQALLAKAEQPAAPSSLSLSPSTLSLADSKSVAVLAFANLSDDKNNEYFSDGISEELLNVLARVPGLKVTARTSSFHFKGKDTPIPEIARQLGIAYVVEGSVRKQGDKVRITAQLIKAADGFHVWSDTFTRDLKDIFAVQDEIAGLIAENLKLKLDQAHGAKRTVNPEAHQLYLRAQAQWKLRTKEGLAQATTQLHQALQLDPDFAPAYALLANLELVRDDWAPDFDAQGNPSARIQAVLSYAERASQLDSQLPDAHVARAGGLAVRRLWTDAEREFRQAIALNPNHATAHQWLARLFEASGRMNEAIAAIQQAVELDPLSARIGDNQAIILLHAGRMREAMAAVERAQILQPDSRQGQSVKAEILLIAGRDQEARPLVEALLTQALTGDAIDANNSSVFRILAGVDDPARLAALGERMADWAAALRALVALRCGQTDEAVALLRANQMSYWTTNEVLWNPSFDPIRSRPEFIALLRDANLTEAHARAQAWRQAHPPEKL